MLSLIQGLADAADRGRAREGADYLLGATRGQVAIAASCRHSASVMSSTRRTETPIIERYRRRESSVEEGPSLKFAKDSVRHRPKLDLVVLGGAQNGRSSAARWVLAGGLVRVCRGYRELNGLIVAPLLFPVQGSRVSEKVQKIPCSFAQGIFRQIAAAAGSFPVA